jgi:hypothetical protein
MSSQADTLMEMGREVEEDAAKLEVLEFEQQDGGYAAEAKRRRVNAAACYAGAKALQQEAETMKFFPQLAAAVKRVGILEKELNAMAEENQRLRKAGSRDETALRKRQHELAEKSALHGLTAEEEKELEAIFEEICR